MESGEGPTQKKARMAYVSYPNFRPEGYDFEAEKEKNTERRSSGPPVDQDPSPVVHIRSLNENVIEADLWSDLNRFGNIVNVFMIKATGQALVEFDSISAATDLVTASRDSGVRVCGSTSFCTFSKSKKIIVPGGTGSGDKPINKVLLLSIQNVCYPITIKVLHTICKPYGEVARIVIFRKAGLQAMVEFVEQDEAVNAKRNLNGTFIYTGCCGLRVDYAKPDKLTVKQNSADSWDFSVDSPEPPVATPSKPRVLLPNPSASLWDGVPGGRGGPPYDAWPGGAIGEDDDNGYGGEGGGFYSGYGESFNGARARNASGGKSHFMGGWGNPPPPPPPPSHGSNGENGSSGAHFYGYGYGESSSGYGAGVLGAYPSGPPGYGGGHYAHPDMMAKAASGEMPNCVMMLYGVNPEEMNCDRLFNLVCLFGNVVRIKFFRSKEDAAMIQMGDQQGVQEAIDHLNNLCVFGNQLRLTRSKQPFVTDLSQGQLLKDGSPAIKDFRGNKCNRFLDPKVGLAKPYPPHTIVHYYNAPPGFDETQMMAAMEEHGATLPDRVKVLGSRNGKNSSGLLQWVKQSDANDAMCLCNHIKLEQSASSVLPGKRPTTFTLKLCYSNIPFIG